MMKNIIKVVGYIRVSIEKQVLETEGLEIQKERIIEFCQKNNYELVRLFVDDGISGAKEVTERPGVVDLLSYCKNSPIQHVIVDKPDRLSRKFENQLFIEMDLKRSKVGVLYATNETTNIDENDTEFDRMMKTAMRQMMGVFAELDRKMINKRLSDGKFKKAKQGFKPAGRQPLGYEYSQDKKNTIINQAQANVIRDIFQLRVDGLSLNQIADKLNSNEYIKKHKNAYKKPKNWINQSVDKILKNDYYIGVLTHATEKFHGNHEAIIDMDTWNAVNNKVV